MIRLTIPAIDEREIEAVADVLRSGFLVQGAKVAAFEAALAEQIGVRHAVAVSSGTAALHLALLSLEIGPGDVVATTAYSWPATANVIELCGARPVFIDIDPHTFNMDCEKLAIACDELATSPTNGRLRSILPVHAFGQPADMTRITEIAERHGIAVIEDAACALGASWEGRPVGSWGKLGCFSFHPRKAITTGEGGLITTNDDELAVSIRSLRNHGLEFSGGRPEFTAAGFNYRLTEMQAAMGSVQLAKLSELIQMRREKAEIYDRFFLDTPIQPPTSPQAASPVFQSYVVRIPDAANQPAVISYMREHGIETTIGTYHIPLTRYFANKYGFVEGQFPVADRVARTAITLPLHQELSRTDQEYVAAMLIESVQSRDQSSRLASSESHVR